jgi:TonB family protein
MKTMKVRPEVSDQEIHHFMDFNNLLVQKDRFLARRRRNRIITAIGVAVLGALIVPSILYIFPGKPAKTSGIEISIPAKEDEQKKSQVSKDENPEPANEAQPKLEEPQIQPLPQKRVLKEKAGPGDKNETTSTSGDDVYVQAVPVNGYPALYTYFNSELVYPPSGIKDSVEGVVTIIFTIDTHGKPVNIQMENSLGDAFDAEAKRLIERMPAWQPASYNGKPVPSKISVPLTFEIQKVN